MSDAPPPGLWTGFMRRPGAALLALALPVERAEADPNNTGLVFLWAYGEGSRGPATWTEGED